MIRSMRLVWVVLLLALGCGAGATAQAPAPRAEPIAGHTDPQPTAPGSSAPLIADLRVELPFNEPLVRLVWGGQVLAQQHFVLDMCARAGDRTRDGYCAFLGWKVASDLDHALDRYLGIRRRWMDAAKASRAAAGADDDRMFVDMLPPSQPQINEAFALAFIRAATVDEAIAALKLEAGDEKDLRAALGVLLPHAAPAPHLEAATRRLQAMAQKVHVESYLSHMVRFYDVQDRVPKEFVVNLLDSAGLSIQATVYGEQIVLPMSVQHLDSEERVQGELGVVVHELGHAMMAQVPDDVRRRVSDTLVHHLGIVQRRHYNIFDEATQTAVGNVLFMNGAFPGTVQDDQFLYNYESDNPKPHAIDHLARFLSPVLAQHFATPGSFAQTYLDDAIAQHEKAFGNAPRYHTRVARVVVGDADGSTLRRIFDQLFWGTSRESMSIEDFVESEVSANPGLTRWALLTGDSRTIDAKRLADSFPMVAEVAEALGLRGACFRAKRRGPGRGYDMVVVGQSVASVRDVLIQIHGMTAVPDDIWCSGPAERKMQ